MGIEVVLNQIVTAGQKEESDILEQAQFERERIVSEARAKADEVRRQGRARADSKVEALRRELVSAAEFEARRHLLVAKRELSEDFRTRVLDALRSFSAPRNQALLAKLAQQGRTDLSSGTVHARKNDLPALTKHGFRSGAELAGIGGFQVESEDGSVMLDFRYETLLDTAWKQILSDNQKLFEV